MLDWLPDRDWQQRYLAEAAVSLEDLEAQMPALRDLSELLQLPFFLSQTVDLYRAGGLGDSHGSVGAGAELRDGRIEPRGRDKTAAERGTQVAS